MKKKKNEEPTQLETGQPNEKEKFFKNLNTWLERELQDRGVVAPPSMPVSTFPRTTIAENYESLDTEGKKTVDTLMDQLKPDIEAKAIELLTNEIRDKIARSGDIKKLQEAATKGKKMEVKRKKGCIFIQLGTGTPTDPIEEFLIANTG